MSILVNLYEREKLLEAIQQVRTDASPVNWAIVGHRNDDPNTLELVATGTEGFSTLRNHFSLEKVQYALLRVTTKVDLSMTVKFVYIHQVGDNVGFAKRGRFSVVHGAVVPFFQPYHVDFDITNIAEISDRLITEKVEKAAGNANFVRDADFAVGKPEFGKNQNQKEASNLALNKSTSNSIQKLNGSSHSLLSKPLVSRKSVENLNIATQSSGITLDDELISAIKEVRNDKSDVQWVAATFKDANIKNPLVVLGKGHDRVDEFKSLLAKDKFVYVLMRVTDIIDGHKTVKFVLIHWIGVDLSMIAKAKVSTFKGALSEKFAPFHVDLVCSEHREVSDLIVADKVSRASGSKSNVQ